MFLKVTNVKKIKKKLIKNKIELFIILLSFFIFSVNILDFPFHPEFGLQGYIGQELIRGYPVFSTLVWTYPPVVYFINAFWMKLFFFLPNYLAMRLGGLIIGIFTVLLFYKVLTKVTTDKLTPIFSALILLSFTFFIEYSFSISVKTVLVFFVVLMFLSLFKKHYLFSGILISLSFMSWQGGLVFIFAPLSYYLLNKEKSENYVKFFTGFIIPLLLIVLYFFSSNLLDKFINYVFTFAWSFKEESNWSNSIFAYMKGWIAFSTTELVFLLFCPISSFLFLFKIIKDKRIHIDNKELFSFILPYFLLFLYTFIDFQPGEDVIPLMPAISLSSAFLFSKMRKKIPTIIVLSFLIVYGFFPMFQPIYPPNPLLTDAKRVNNLNDLLVIMGNYTYPEIMYYSLFHRLGRDMNLQQQLDIAEYINDNMNDTDTIFSLGASELLFLIGKRNINKYTQLSGSPLRVYVREEGIREELKNNITESSPKFIVSWVRLDNNEPALKFLGIKDFVETNYEMLDVHPKYVIWKKV